jgi:acetylornithine/succinyldiaminopimelate/putrescine aminotransferase
MHQSPSLAETCEQILSMQEPNFLRLYLNPHVAQTCFCLDRYVRTTWTEPVTSVSGRHETGEDRQSFLANGLEEALSGAIKLARYCRNLSRVHSIGVIFDPVDRLVDFASARLNEVSRSWEGEAPSEPVGSSAQQSTTADRPPGIARGLSHNTRVSFLPGVQVIGADRLSAEPGTLDLEGAPDNGDIAIAANINPLVLVAGADQLLDKHADRIRLLVQRQAPVVITCVDRRSLAALRHNSRGILHEIVPDIVVFDESFVEHAVPFGAFTARKSLFAWWNRAGKATFHSTTFQPNTISTLHFMRCLAEADPDFYRHYSEVLEQLPTDLARQGDWFRRYYNPSLYRLIRATGFNIQGVRASGSFVFVGGRPVYDAVSGVACSFRGHNPPAYADEIKTLAGVMPDGNGAELRRGCDGQSACEAELRRRLEDLTGLEYLLPAVSGATAVENALKLALLAQAPKRHILVLRAGFGGKTLLALTGTANPAYKERIEPLYPDVHYIDAVAPDAEAEIESQLKTGKFALVQVELIQAVGGVRAVPQNVLRLLDEGRKRWGYLLLVDEVQTGMYRTGSFTLSQTLGLAPDLLLLGKATTDMMFPFALTLYSAKVQAMLEQHGSNLTDSIKRRYAYESGYKTVINVLRLAEEMNISRHVSEAAGIFAELLESGLASTRIVRDVRVFGLLIGIELDTRRWPHRWLHKRLSSFYLFGMLRHAQFPLLAGFCQYEPNVLKITPPLNTSPDEIRQASATIIDVLNRPLGKVLAAGLGGFLRAAPVGRRQNEHRNDPALEPVAR